MDKITFFSTSPNIGGSEKVLINIANEFAQLNLEVEFIFCSSTGNLRDELHPDIKIINLNTRVRWAVLKLYKIVLTRKPTVIISGPQSINFISIIVSKLPFTNFKTIATHHNFHNSEIKSSFLGSFNLLFIEVLYSLANKIIAVSNEIKSHLVVDCKVQDSRVKVINNPVVNQRMILQSKEDVAEFPFKENKPIIIAVGRLAKIKNYPLMLESFSFLLKKMPAYLVIIGEGEEHDHILEIIKSLNLKDLVVLLGAKSNPYKYISKSNLLIHTSLSESFGMVLAESLALGINVISSNTSGAIEVTDNGKYGTIYFDKDPEKIATEMYSILNFGYDRNQLIERGLFFSCEKISIEYLNLINQI